MDNRDEQKRKELNNELLKRTYKSEMKRMWTDKSLRKRNMQKTLPEVVFVIVSYMIADFICQKWFADNLVMLIICLSIVFFLLHPIERIFDRK